MSYSRFKRRVDELEGGTDPYPAWRVNPILHDLLDKDEPIWRYTTVPQLINSLRKPNTDGYFALHFTRTSWFEDDFEGTVPERNIQNSRENLEKLQGHDDDYDIEEHLKSQFGSQLPNHDDDDGEGAMERLRELVYLNCWTHKKLESNPMWHAYTNDNTGIAIKSTVGSLIDSISEWESRLFHGRVQYIDFDETQFPLSAIQHFFLKRQEFLGEDEFRLALNFKETPAMMIPNDAEEMASPPENDHLDVTADLNSLASEITVHPQSDSYLKPMLENVLDKYGVDPGLVTHSSLRVE